MTLSTKSTCAASLRKIMFANDTDMIIIILVDDFISMFRPAHHHEAKQWTLPNPSERTRVGTNVGIQKIHTSILITTSLTITKLVNIMSGFGN